MSISRSASRKPNETPGRAAAEVVLGQPDQPGQLTARGGPGVVEPEQHEDRQVGSRGTPRETSAGSGESAGSAPGHARAAGRRRPRCAPGHVARVRDRHLEQRLPHAPDLGAGAPVGGLARPLTGLVARRMGGVDNALLFDARARVLADLQARHHATARGGVGPRGRGVRRASGGPSSGPRAQVYVAGLVAQDVQDALFETRRALAGLPDLRRGPEHSLYIQPDLGGPDPVWVCEESGDVGGAAGRSWATDSSPRRSDCSEFALRGRSRRGARRLVCTHMSPPGLRCGADHRSRLRRLDSAAIPGPGRQDAVQSPTGRCRHREPA